MTRTSASTSTSTVTGTGTGTGTSTDTGTGTGTRVLSNPGRAASARLGRRRTVGRYLAGQS